MIWIMLLAALAGGLMVALGLSAWLIVGLQRDLSRLMDRIDRPSELIDGGEP